MSRPTCGSCRTRRTECTYSKRRGKPGPQKKSQHARPGASADTVDAFHFQSNRQSSSEESSLYNPIDWSLDFNTPVLDCQPFSGSTTDAFPETGPSIERYLLDLYLRHVQPTYPLFRREPFSSALKMSDCLKMAMFAVASRFATSDNHRESLLSPAEYAKRAQELEHHPSSSSLSLDKIKASILLCIYHVTETGSWDSIANVGKVARMAEWYHTTHVNKSSTKLNTECDEEEWRSVWWTIYTLDVVCSALTVSSHSTNTRLQEHIELPYLSVSEFTNSQTERCSPTQTSPGAQLLTPLPTKHWETVQGIFYGLPQCSRNLYLGVTSIMRAVTELRIAARHSRNTTLQTQLFALESDCTCVTFALPTWMFNPARYFEEEETSDEHRSRLGVLLVLHCARIMLKVTKSRLVNDSLPETMKEQDCRTMWQALLAEANEIVAILQSWKPEYFETVDPMLSYIIFVAACVLILNDKVDVALGGPRSSNHIDVTLLFLSQVGQFWPIGSRLKGSLQNLQKLQENWNYQEMLQFMFETANLVTLQPLFEKQPISFQSANPQESTAEGGPCSDLNTVEITEEQTSSEINFLSGPGWCENDTFNYSDIFHRT